MSNDNLEILRDSWDGAELSLVESVDTPKGEYSSVVLATLKGPALDYIHDTRNNRGYEEDLWDAVANSEYVQELFATKNFLGEPDHPMQWENRSDIHYPYVSHAIRELRKVPEKGYYEVVIDILDTPNGRILKTLIDYGVKLGVSSRGAGRTTIKNGRVIVDKNTYRFITIDIVPMPGNKSARMDKTNESMKIDGLINALTEQVTYLNESNNVESLKYTRMLLDRLEYPECKNLIEKVDGMIESNTDTDNTNDLVEAYALIADLRQQLTSKDLTIKGLNEKVEQLSSCQSTQSGIEDKYNKARDMVQVSLRRESELRRNNAELSEKLAEAKSSLDSLNESFAKSTKVESQLRSQVSELMNRINEFSSVSDSKYNELLESYESAESANDSLTEQLNFVTTNCIEIYEKYVDTRCSQLGVNSTQIKKRLGDLTQYTADELNKFITESFKQTSASHSTKHGLIPGSTHSVRLNEQLSPQDEASKSELDAMRANVAAVRMQ